MLGELATSYLISRLLHSPGENKPPATKHISEQWKNCDCILMKRKA